jgi:small subunit ribosomal protein S6
MAFYESIIIVRHNVSLSDVDKIVDDLKKTVKEHKGGKIIKTEYWGLRSLAYKIENNKKGHYCFMGIEANKSIIDKIGRKISLSESIIRSSLVKVREISTDPSPILKDKSSDNENTVDITTKKIHNN